MIWVLVCKICVNMNVNLVLSAAIQQLNGFVCSKWVNTDLTKKQNRPFFFIKIQQQGKILSPMCIYWGKMWKSNEKNIFQIKFHVLSEWSMPRGSSSIIAQSLKTLQQNGPKLVYTQKNPNNNKYMCIIDILSLCEKKKKKLLWLKLLHSRKIIILIEKYHDRH